MTRSGSSSARAGTPTGRSTGACPRRKRSSRTPRTTRSRRATAPTSSIPDGELRAYMMYPCRVRCSEPLAGKVSISARYHGLEHEWVTIRNNSIRADRPVRVRARELTLVLRVRSARRDRARQVDRRLDHQPHRVPLTNGGRSLGRAGSRPVPERPAWWLPELGPQATRCSTTGATSWFLGTRQGRPVPGACDVWGNRHCPRV